MEKFYGDTTDIWGIITNYTIIYDFDVLSNHSINS